MLSSLSTGDNSTRNLIDECSSRSRSGSGTNVNIYFEPDKIYYYKAKATESSDLQAGGISGHVTASAWTNEEGSDVIRRKNALLVDILAN